jgi:MFS family permease
MMGGIRYLRNEKGVRNIYTYMATSIAVGNGNYLMSMAYFQSGANGFTTAMFSFLQSSETLGRMAGGLLHYIVKIPPKWRYKITESVYFAYNAIDGIMLLLAYPLMVVLRFIVGFLGVNSMTLREAAVQRKLPSEVRARVEALFTVMISLGQMAMGLVAGALGEVLRYPVVSAIFGAAGLLCVYALVTRKRRISRQSTRRKILKSCEPAKPVLCGGREAHDHQEKGIVS